MSLPEPPTSQTPSHADVLSAVTDNMVPKLPGALPTWTPVIITACGKDVGKKASCK